MEDVICDEQFAAVAERVNGDVTWEPIVGIVTVTLAKAGVANVTRSNVE
jgi:hypothetical protein